MTTETENAIDVLVQCFLLDQEQTNAEVTKALETVSCGKSFEALGKAVYRAMLQAHQARLQAEQATLIAQLPREGFH